MLSWPIQNTSQMEEGSILPPYNPDAPSQTPPWHRATTQGTSEDYPYSYADGRTIPFVQQLSNFASEPAYCDVAAGSSREDENL